MDLETTRATLLSRVRDAADHAAWREFDGRYRELILRYCTACGMQYADAEDVRQIVMLSLVRSLRGFDYSPQRGRFRHYLGRVVKNAISHHRSRPNPASTLLDNSVLALIAGDDAGEPDAVWQREWVDHHYRLAMETIRRTFEPRSVRMFERVLAGDSIDDIARAFDTTTQAVHKIKQRIRERMRELIAGQVLDEQPNAEAEG